MNRTETKNIFKHIKLNFIFKYFKLNICGLFYNLDIHLTAGLYRK